MDDQIRRTILALCDERAPKTICPSEVSRALRPDDWRPLMEEVRRVAAQLQSEGLILATQGGRPVDPLDARGPIRLQRKSPH